MKPYIIAEIGNNHEGDLQLALEMVRQANECGADAVKFQTFVPELYANKINIDRFKMLQRFVLKTKDYEKIVSLCDDLNIDFISTPFDLESAKFLNKLTNKIKVSSGDNNLDELIAYCIENFDQIFISSGLVDTNLFIKSLLDKFSFRSLKKVTPLFCVALYPHEPKDSSVSAIQKLTENKQNFNSVGYSDHTRNNVCAVVAMALGASIFEKHFTLDNNLSDFRDHRVALNPVDFSNYVNDLNTAFEVISSQEDKVLSLQLENQKGFRRSPIYNADYNKGSVFSSEMFDLVRPEIGITIDEVKQLFGKPLVRKVKKRSLVEKRDFG